MKFTVMTMTLLMSLTTLASENCTYINEWKGRDLQAVEASEIVEAVLGNKGYTRVYHLEDAKYKISHLTQDYAYDNRMNYIGQHYSSSIVLAELEDSSLTKKIYETSWTRKGTSLSHKPGKMNKLKYVLKKVLSSVPECSQL